MERHHNAGHKNTRVIFWLISLMVLVASPSMVQAAITCNQCHGGDGSSNVKDSPSGTRNPADGTFKGNHGTHLPNNPAAVQCTVCHGAGAASYTSTHSTLSNNQIQMASKLDNYSGLKRARYGTKLFWNMTTLPQLTTCNNVNCHFERTTDQWGSAAYVNADVATCSKCHDALPTTAAHSRHITAYGGGLASCNQCHSNYTTAAGKMKFQHATSAGRPIIVTTPYVGSNNKYLPGPASTGRTFGSCSVTYCHSAGQSTASGTVATPTYKSASWTTTGTVCATELCHPTGRGNTISGSHVKHLTDLTITCASCHTGVSTDGATYAFGGTHINTSIDVAAGLGYTAAGAAGNGYGTCATASCHNNGTTDAVQPVPTAWGNTAAACTACHASMPTTGAHIKHMVTTQYKLVVCGQCHVGANHGSNAGIAHLDNNIDVDPLLGFPPDLAKHPSGAYSATCATAYCHSPGQSAAGGALTAPDYQVLNWGTAVTCGSCHKVAKSTGLTSGGHNIHLGANGVNGCADCHTGATNNASAYNSTAHVDNVIDVAASLGYSQTGLPGNGNNGFCATAACHSNGTTSALAQTPAWNSTGLGCSACHGGTAANMTSGAHDAHLVLNSSKFTNVLTCTNCHANAGTTTGGHLNSTVQVDAALGYPQLIAPHAVGTYSGTCTTVCHADAGSNAAYNTIRNYVPVNWGVASTGCNFCHPMANLSGTHSKHAGRINLASTTRGYANYTANVSGGQEGAGGGYGFGCTTCHPSTVASHLNGTIEVTFAADAQAGSMRAKNAGATLNNAIGSGVVTCTATYCHGTGLANSGTTPAWNVPFSGDRCAYCHGNSPTTGAHGAHKVGIHYDNIFSGVSGFLGYSSSGNKAHGVATQSTTISCNVCHSSTITTAFNKNGTTCNSCHSADPGLAVLDAVNGFAFHVNGKVDVSFPAANMRSKAQIRDTSFSVYSGLWTRNGGVNNYKKDATSYDISKQQLNTSIFTPGVAGQGSCANVVCHNQRTGQTVTWNQTLQCVDCHSQL